MIKIIKSDLRRNIIKVLCLAAGLSIGLLLVVVAYLDLTVDSYMDSARTYRVVEKLELGGQNLEHGNTPGAIAPGLKRYVPQVEAATHVSVVAENQKIKVFGVGEFESTGIALADSCFFDVISRHIISGDPHEVLSVSGHCMIPESLADRIGEDVIGKKISWVPYEEEVEIGGIYEDFPLNSTLSNCIYVAMPTSGEFWHSGDRDTWLGSDRYYSYVRLTSGTSPDDIKFSVRKMLEENISAEDLEQTRFDVSLVPVNDFYLSMPGMRTKNMTLWVLAVIILVSTTLNYLLVVVAQIHGRVKEIAVRKVFGTDRIRIFADICRESALFLCISVLIAVIILLLFSHEYESRMLGMSVKQLLLTGNAWMVECAAIILLFVITGVVPALMCCRISVKYAFRVNTLSRNALKKVLLAVQFFSTGLFFCLLVIVMRQYNMMVKSDLGYRYDNVGIVDANAVEPYKREKIIDELQRLGNVVSVATASRDFTHFGSGGGVYPPGEPDKISFVEDMQYANPEIFELLDIKFNQGEPFFATSGSHTYQVVVEESMIEVLNNIFDIDGRNIVGKKLCMTGHNSDNEYEIVGVVNDMTRGSFVSEQLKNSRPALFLPSNDILEKIYVKFHVLTPSALHEAQQVIDQALPDGDIVVMPLKTRVDALSSQVQAYSYIIVIGGIVIMIISFSGLVGYVSDDVQRRAREIAIRKVNGMEVKDIIRMFCVGMSKITLPSLLAGSLVAMIAGSAFVSQFTVQIKLSIIPVIGVVAAIWVLVMLTVVACCITLARANPIHYLRRE